MRETAIKLNKMKKVFVILSASTLLFASCVSNPEGKKAETTDAIEVVEVSGNELPLNTVDSKLRWEAHKVTAKHYGEVDIKSGTLLVDSEGQLTGGNFIIDLATIEVQDLEGEFKEKLTGHLKSDDFFGIEKFPAASFVIKKVTANGNNANITGDLTIKGVTNPITFPATITWNADKTVTAVADKIVIDRTKYGIQFKSKSIFSNIGDNFIYDEFTLSVKLVAKK